MNDGKRYRKRIMNSERSAIIMPTRFSRFCDFASKFILGWLVFLGLGLIGCVPQTEQEAAATLPVTRVGVEEEATDVAVVRPSPTNNNELVDGTALTLTPTPIGGNVHCGDLTEGVEEKSYWVDDFIPGESTIDDLLQVNNVEITETPKREGFWAYYDDDDFYFRLFFSDGVLWEKWDPRMQLGEIISHYGHPTEVTWELLDRTKSFRAKVNSDTESVEGTVLFFPHSNAIFSGEGQITGFYVGTEFFGSIYSPDFYEEVYESINDQSERFHQLIQFPWPCG